MLYLTSVNELAVTGEAENQERWIAEMANGNTAAVAALYENAKTAVYGFALSLLKNTHDAEDVLQDCFVKVFEASPTYRAEGKPLAWILTIARNLCLQKLREHKRNADIPEEDWEPYLASREEISVEDRVVLETCMKHLSEEERQIVMLYAVAGFKHREIASVLSLPLATVLSKYHRALKKLKNLL